MRRICLQLQPIQIPDSFVGCGHATVSPQRHTTVIAIDKRQTRGHGLCGLMDFDTGLIVLFRVCSYALEDVHPRKSVGSFSLAGVGKSVLMYYISFAYFILLISQVDSDQPP